MIESLCVSLVLTLMIELPVSFILGMREKEDFEVVFWVNVLTNPVVVFGANCMILLNNPMAYNIYVAIVEITVVIVEGMVFKRLLTYQKKSPFLISLLNNGISYGLGVVIGLLLY